MFTDIDNATLFALLGFVTGVLGAILGTGGGVFIIPVLVLLFDIPMHYAVASSIVSVVATSSAVASANVERGTANMPLGMTLEMATALGAITGGLTAGALSASSLETLFGIVLLPTAFLMWRGGEGAEPKGGDNKPATAKVSPPADATGKLGATFYDTNLGREVAYRVKNLWAGLLISFFAGNLSGLLGIGGGIFKVPGLNLACHIPIKAAVATSNFMIGVTAAASGFLYLGRGEVRPALTASIVLGVLAGSIVGSYLNQFVGGRFVKRLFAVMLTGVAIQMLSKVVFQWG